MKQVSIAAFALALFSLHPVASAQVATPFMTVDAVNVNGNDWTLIVTGVVQGEAAPTTRIIKYMFGSEAEKIAAREFCHRQLLLALSKPGQYVVQAGYNLCNVSLVVP
jgi:hypothetical protein